MTLDFALMVAVAGVVLTAAGLVFLVYNSWKKELDEILKPVDQIRQYAIQFQYKLGSSRETAPSDAELQATAKEIVPKLSEALSIAVLPMSGRFEVYNPSKEFLRMVDEFARTGSPERHVINKKANDLQNKIAAFKSAYKKQFIIHKILMRSVFR